MLWCRPTDTAAMARMILVYHRIRTNLKLLLSMFSRIGQENSPTVAAVMTAPWWLLGRATE
jgi:hypothetical protein